MFFTCSSGTTGSAAWDNAARELVQHLETMQLFLFTTWAVLVTNALGHRQPHVEHAQVRLDAISSVQDGEQNFEPNAGSSMGRTQGLEITRPQQLNQQLNATVLDELRSLLATMQMYYFEDWLGTWPSAIDWTAAVLNTHLLAAVTSISSSLVYTSAEGLSAHNHAQETNISAYLSQSLAYYFVEDAFSIRQQAHDDMQWVVLGWLEGIRFHNLHARLHYGESAARWWGKQWTSAWAHRARVFYDIVFSAWNADGFCGGGLTWDPKLEPYKNAVTNEQFVSSSVAMYLYHPGDNNSSPFIAAPTSTTDAAGAGSSPLEAHDARFLNMSIRAYDWLQAVDLRGSFGLYVDGYHITSAAKRNRTLAGRAAQCNDRNEMIYTYNQGILLSGLRQLWEATGNMTYLRDGHDLVASVMKATGWRESTIPSSAEDALLLNLTVSAFSTPPRANASLVNPLGIHGILTEFCDPSGTCSQDGQIFKSIFFHHLTTFCAALPLSRSDVKIVPGISHIAKPETAVLHRNSCKSYAPWVARNARAALGTKDKRGIVGGWWGAEVQKGMDEWQLPAGAVDWRNGRQDKVGRGNPREPLPQEQSEREDMGSKSRVGSGNRQPPKDGRKVHDPNERGRGRSVETHAGGVAVVRCLWELLRLFG